MMVYGYARISTREQNEARQCAALEEAGVKRKQIYVDKCSGKDFERTNYKRLVRRLKAGDVLIIKSIDRLGRNYEEILAQWRILTKDKGADIVILDMPLLDTRRNNDLTGTLIADIVLQLLSYVAETERNFIRQRQREGIQIAIENGIRFGRRPMKRPEEFETLKEEYLNKKVSAREAARRLGIAHTTFLSWTKS